MGGLTGHPRGEGKPRWECRVWPGMRPADADGAAAASSLTSGGRIAAAGGRSRSRLCLVHTGAAILACVVLALLVVFQGCLSLGAPWGRLAWGGQHDGRLPARLRVASAASIGLYVAFAVLLLDRAGVVDAVSADALVRTGSWVLVGYLVLGVLMNAVSRSKAERAVMTPTAFVLAVCATFVAAGPHG